MRTRAAVAVTGLLVVAACGADEPIGAGPGADGAAPTSAVDALWAADDPVVAVGAPATPWLPGPEAGELALVRAPSEEPTLSIRDTDAPAQTLYLDQATAEVDTAPALVVGRTEVSDIDGVLPVPEGEAVEVQGVEGQVAEVHGLVVVSWPNPDVSDDCACDQTLFVAGRGIGREGVLAAAEGAEPLAELPALAPLAVGDLASLGTSPAVLGRDLSERPPAQVVELAREGTDLRVTVVGSDPRLVPHVRFWAPDGAEAIPWDRPLVAAVLDDETVAVATSTRFGGGADEPIDLAADVPAAEAALDALAPATDDDLVAAQQEILTGVALPPCATGAEDQVDVAGTAGQIRWTIGVAYVEGALWTCEAATGVDGSSGPSGGGGGMQPLDLAAPVQVVGGSTTGDGTGAWTRSVIGHVRADAATVEVVVPGAAPTPAVRAATGPAPDRVWFAAVVPVAAPDPDAATTVVVRDAAGREL